jgi:anaerobic selenocysteine-containing dehydrogenase
VRRRLEQNFAYLNPQDMDALALEDGECVEITSAHGTIDVPARSDASVRCGVVSVPHGWGDLLDTADGSALPGANTNKLTSATEHADPINAMPCLTGLPVRLRRCMQL